MKKVFAIILGIVTLITAWSTIKMILALAHTDQNIYMSLAPLPINLSNPNTTVILVSAIIYAVVTITLAGLTIKLSKSK
ncbi:hypothetical protein N9R04_10035 [Staphylococcus sp. SQ8-PEA]|uniref:DUF4321 domain-containing protein n=2 Tax=Staphylococcus marylandisciuri TaxID=2981529 RepID=A0ABT2QSN3_9STAP|nr:hypothetical protein [Staphylococcus marylandisciuri]